MMTMQNTQTLTWSTFSSSPLAALLSAMISFILASFAAFSSGVRAFTASVLSLKSLWEVCRGQGKRHKKERNTKKKQREREKIARE